MTCRLFSPDAAIDGTLLEFPGDDETGERAHRYHRGRRPSRPVLASRASRHPGVPASRHPGASCRPRSLPWVPAPRVPAGPGFPAPRPGRPGRAIAPIATRRGCHSIRQRPPSRPGGAYRPDPAQTTSGGARDRPTAARGPVHRRPGRPLSPRYPSMQQWGRYRPRQERAGVRRSVAGRRYPSAWGPDTTLPERTRADTMRAAPERQPPVPSLDRLAALSGTSRAAIRWFTSRSRPIRNRPR